MTRLPVDTRTHWAHVPWTLPASHHSVPLVASLHSSTALASLFQVAGFFSLPPISWLAPWVAWNTRSSLYYPIDRLYLTSLPPCWRTITKDSSSASIRFKWRLCHLNISRDCLHTIYWSGIMTPRANYRNVVQMRMRASVRARTGNYGNSSYNVRLSTKVTPCTHLSISSIFVSLAAYSSCNCLTWSALHSLLFFASCWSLLISFSSWEISSFLLLSSDDSCSFWLVRFKIKTNWTEMTRIHSCVFVFVSACVRVRLCACVRACVRACVCVSTRVCKPGFHGVIKTKVIFPVGLFGSKPCTLGFKQRCIPAVTDLPAFLLSSLKQLNLLFSPEQRIWDSQLPFLTPQFPPV